MSERMVQRGLRINIAAGCFGMAFVAAAAGVPFTMLLERLGATGIQLGLAVTIQQLAMLASIPAALFSERMDMRKPFWAALAMIHRVLWFIPALLPLLWTGTGPSLVWVIVGVVGVSAASAQASAPLWFSWLADLVPDRIRGRFWGKRQSLVTVSFLVVTGLFGWILDRYAGHDQAGAMAGFALVFGIAALLGVLDVVVHLWVPEPKPAPPPRSAPLGRRLGAILGHPGFLRLSLAMGGWTMAVGMTGAFQLVYLSRAFNATYSHLSLLAISASLGAVAAGLLLGLVIDRLGARAVGHALIKLGPLTGVVWFVMREGLMPLPFAGGRWTLPQPVFLLLFTNFIGGGLYSGVGLCQLRLLGSLIPREGRTLAMAVHWTLIGALTALGPVLGGSIMDAMTAHPVGWVMITGLPFSFFHLLVLLHMALAWAVVAPLWRGLPRDASAPRGEGALGMIRPGNPLRALTGIYSLWQTVTPRSSGMRARAVQRLGESRLGLSVPDLIARLDDPDNEVREQAALALGAIGGPEAVHALIGELQDPESDLGPHAARALRATRDPRSVEALLDRLQESDGETARESARALGAIADPRAADPLRTILRETSDHRLVAASSEALARIGEVEALYDILPRMKSARNPVLRRSMAVAAGDLLGEPGGFYRVLIREEETRGAEAHRLLREIRRLLRRRFPAQKRARLLAIVDRLEDRVENGPLEEAARELRDLAVETMSRVFRTEGESVERLIDEVSETDSRTAVAIWFLDLLYAHWEAETLGARDAMDLLLGLYALHGLVRRLKCG